ncbi:MAG: DNA polymerase-1 [Limisphaerales bacterium]|jgi:DNA polymerase-1
MANRLFLLDGMALIYRAHFAFIHRPIMNSQGVNTSALYGFTNTLLEIIERQKPTHLAVAFDTSAPTERHEVFPEYKAQREATPEDLREAIPHVFRMVEAFNIPVLRMDGFEADDIIGTVAKRFAAEDMEVIMVSPDKDFGQLVEENIYLYRPGRGGGDPELLGVPEVLEKWQIKRIDQVIEVQGLQGDAVDNIPGIPGIGPKTAQKLIAQFDTIENLLANTDQLKGKQKERVIEHGEQALLSKRLARINLEVPVEISMEELTLTERNDEALQELCSEFEFASIGRRLFGSRFKSGMGQGLKPVKRKSDGDDSGQPEIVAVNLKTLKDVKHTYRVVTQAAERAELIRELSGQTAFCFTLETSSREPRAASIIGIAVSHAAHAGAYVILPGNLKQAQAALDDFRPLFENDAIEKVGHDLKFALSVLKWHGIDVRGKLFDALLAHSLIEPDQKHTLEFLSEVYLSYTPIPRSELEGEQGDLQMSMALTPPDGLADFATEAADVAWQLRGKLVPYLQKKDQERVFYDIEAPLIPILIGMEHEGVRIDSAALGKFATELAGQIGTLEKEIHELAGQEFNVGSPKQLGEILFEKLKLLEKPKKTKTGQYSTNEQVLLTLSHEHEIVRKILEIRQASKLKSTYADSLPDTIWSRTGRVHTTYNQAVTTTGRLQSINPNLQNIPIRSAMGREIRRAFIPRDENHLLLSADYSQIELRIIAAVSKDAGMIEAFAQDLDIHAATAAKVYGVELEEVTSEMRSAAKMVNFGLAYGMTAFGLSQRLGIPRKEAVTIMDEYFNQFPGIRSYMNETLEFARENEFVETLTGRRRYLRDINSANGMTRGQAERNAINMPIQGTAADMIKIAMTRVANALAKTDLKTKMILQVHDELVFDMPKGEERQLRPLVEEHMKDAISLDVPIGVEIGTGTTWLEAH